MDPTTAFCPNGPCHARGQTGQGHIGIHAQQEQRFICHACHKTFSARTGTVFYRLRTAAETVVFVVTLLAQGCPVPAIVAALTPDRAMVRVTTVNCTATALSVHHTQKLSKKINARLAACREVSARCCHT